MRRPLSLFALVLFTATAVTLLQAQGQPPAGGTTVKLGAEGQFRLIVAHAPRSTAVDEDEAGFQLRRARLVLTGTFLEPANTFRLRSAYDRATGLFQFDDFWMARQMGGTRLQVGQFKPQFLREEFISSFAQLSAERSYAADYFTIDYTQGVEGSWERPRWRSYLAVHDGSYQANTDFANDRTDGAAAGRMEWRMGEAPWGVWKDNSGWAGQHGALLGVAADYERGERGGGVRLPDVAKVTADLSVKGGGIGVMGVAAFQHFTAPDTTGGIPAALDGSDQLYAMVEAGWFVRPDKVELVARWEHTDFGGAYYRNNGELVQSGSRALAADRLDIWTVGAGWHLHPNAAKLTTELQYAPGQVPVAGSSVGLLRSDRGGEVAFISQIQFRF